jgi:hypothetical protein
VLVGGVEVPADLRAFVLPFVAVATLLFYLLTKDKRISRWEGLTRRPRALATLRGRCGRSA